MEIEFQNYRLPGDFEPHDCTWFMWPTRPDNWRESGLHAQNILSNLINLVSQFEPVKLAYEQTPPKINLNAYIESLEYDDIWVRDTGPIILTNENNNLIGIDWQFNSWGGLFESFAKDNAVAEQICNREGIRLIKAPLVLEGGAITCDGNGTIIVTEESILDEKKNPEISKSVAEYCFKRYLNITNVIWLPEGLKDDEAGGHVDNLCVFASQKDILLSYTNDKNNPNYEVLKNTIELLKSAKNIQGENYNIHLLPVPPIQMITLEESLSFSQSKGEINRVEGEKLAASYINLMFVNGGIILPGFDCSEDHVAVELLRAAFPERQVELFKNTKELLMGGGNIHCLSKEIPQKI